MRRKVPYFRRMDKWLFLAPVAIFLIGILSIYSASFKSNQPFDQTLALKQMLWMGMGILMVFLVIRFDYFKLQDFGWPLYAVSFLLLGGVFFMSARLGAHRWINLGGFNLQPSELAKLSVMLVLSRFFANNRIEYASLGKRLLPFVIVGIPFLLILKEPDLGTALMLLPSLLAMLYLWGFSKKDFMILLFLGALLSPALFFFLKDYQKARLMVFMNPNADPLGAGYTIIQSKIAIGSGGFLGKGFMGGTQNQLNFVPERHTDFIFAVIGEEGGFVIGLLVMALFWFVVKKGYSICAQTPDRFGSQLACGITTLIGTQAVVNFGMTMGLLPVVGVPLPLVSYGGTSVLVTMLLIGLLLNIKIHRPLF